MRNWGEIRDLLAPHLGMVRARELIRAEYDSLAVRLAMAVPARDRGDFLDRMVERDFTHAELVGSPLGTGAVDPEPTIEAPSPICSCGHPLSGHSLRSAGDGRVILGCGVAGCNLGCRQGGGA